MNDIINITNKPSISFDDLGLSQKHIDLITWALSFATEEKQKLINIKAESLTQPRVDELYKISTKHFKISNKKANTVTLYSKSLFKIMFTVTGDLNVIKEITIALDSLLAFVLGHIDKDEMLDTPFYSDDELFEDVDIMSIDIYNTK